ncbi:MAG: VCBS repeat-containing protein [Myxococcales bacterium]|nr:VCBS repeat-containing protein [Myxococcales bacterium]
MVCLELEELGRAGYDEGLQVIDTDGDGLDETWMFGDQDETAHIGRMDILEGTGWMMSRVAWVNGSFPRLGWLDGDAWVDLVVYRAGTGPHDGVYEMHLGIEGGFDPEPTPTPWGLGVMGSPLDIDRDGSTDMFLSRYGSGGVYELWLGDPAGISVLASELPLPELDSYPDVLAAREPNWMVVGTEVRGSHGSCSETMVRTLELQGASLELVDELSLADAWRIIDAWDDDGDGRPDVLTLHCEDGGTYEVLQHRTQPGSPSPVSLATGVVGPMVITADLDGDGSVELLWADTEDAVWIRRGGPAGLGEPQQATLTTMEPLWARAVGDFDGDGRERVLVRDSERSYALLGESPCP